MWDHQYRIAHRLRDAAIEARDRRCPTRDRPARHGPGPPVPAQVMLREDVVIHLVHTAGDALSRPVKHRIEGLALVAFEILLGGPVVVLERGDAGAPLEMVAQLVAHLIPRLAMPFQRPVAPPHGPNPPVLD